MAEVSASDRAAFFTWEGETLWFATGTTSRRSGAAAPPDPNHTPVRITPTRVELSKMFGALDQRVWRRR
jgi:hypothetical protein